MSAPPEDGQTDSGCGDPPAAAQATDDVGDGEEVRRLRSRVSQLDTELERKDAKIEAVRRQYEAILQRETYQDGSDEHGSHSGLLDLLR